MAKFIIAKTLTIKVNNYNFGSPNIQMDIPMSYSLHDLIQIVKMATGYTDNYDWTFGNPYEENKNLSLKINRDKIENTSFDEYRHITPYIICTYGTIELHLGVRGFFKYRKVYPTMYMLCGRFPTEGEFINDMKISEEEMNLMKNKDELKDLGESLKGYFKNKYKISDEIVENSTFGENKLVRK